MTSEKNNADFNIASVSSEGNSSRVSDTLKAVTSHPLSLNDVADDFTSEQKLYILKKLNYDTLVSFDDLPLSASYMLEKISKLPVSDAVAILKEFVVVHDNDVNIKTEDFEFVEKLLAAAPESGVYSGIDSKFDEKNDVSERIIQHNEWNDVAHGEYDIFDWELQVKTEAGIIEFHSPYAEVRGVTEPYDDADLPCETLRVYIVGIIWTAIGAFINEFFKQRQPSISLNSAVVQVFLYPSGLLLAWVLPKYKLKLWKWTLDLNPGPWNHKEQMLATLFYAVSGGTPNALRFLQSPSRQDGHFLRC
ncbi:hypothetical protein JCM33374_g2406 [Metschnikowia sp. JCM 33374]|nr:hypothetical protein JCM33374_g2406 [Metschnikowia sp. JCM 33374]